MIRVFILISFVLVSCGVSKINEDSTYGELVFKSKLTNFSKSETFRTLSSYSCESDGISKMIKAVNASNYSSLTVVCYSGYLGEPSTNLKDTKIISDFISKCLEDKLEKKITIKSIGKLSVNYELETDISMNNIKLKKGDIISKERTKDMDKRTRVFLESLLKRIEIYGR